MANPTLRSSFDRSIRQWQLQVSRLPLLARRSGAWAGEIALIAASALVPWGLGEYAKVREIGQPVPLNPVLVSMQDAIANGLSVPLRQRDRQVSPLTNLFWSGAILLPIAVGGWQLYLLAKTGQTLPKRWFGVQVVAAAGMPPGWKRVLRREAIGRWGLLVGIAYAIWRYSGAFPDLGILSALTGLLLAADGTTARFHSQGRALHDRIGGTYVLDAAQSVQFETTSARVAVDPQPDWHPRGEDDDTAITAIVLSPEAPSAPQPGGLWLWMRQHPGLTLLIVSLSAMASVLGTFVGTQVYIQQQANWREFQQQDNEVFLALVSKLAPTSAEEPNERRSAILALGAIEDPRAIPLLVDLLGQEESPESIEAIQQALVSRGSPALPHLQRLNQGLKNDLESLSYAGNAREQQTLALRLRATQRAIAKILTAYSGQLPDTDLSRTDLSQPIDSPAPFTLVLDRVNLAGIEFRGSILARASLEGARFYAAGEDGRWGTFDDWIGDLSGADLKEANLSQAFLSRAWLDRTNLMRANLENANLSQASLRGANLSSTQLVGANLQGATLTGTSLTGADLSTADLSNATLKQARLGQVIAQGGQFERVQSSQSSWQGADLSGANFARANLQQADLSGVNLNDANLRGANLQGANLQGADLSAADLRHAQLDGANFKGVTFVAARSSDASEFIEPSSDTAQSARVEGVDFTNVENLSARQLSYACDRGGIHPRCNER